MRGALWTQVLVLVYMSVQRAVEMPVECYNFGLVIETKKGATKKPHDLWVGECLDLCLH